jgi:S1-C subfamily serine protease
MSAPKRLWSGDWQRESDALSEDLARIRANRPDPEPAPAPATTPRRVRPERIDELRSEIAGAPGNVRSAIRSIAAAVIGASPRLKKALPISLAALLIMAAGAYAITSMLGSSGPAASSPVSAQSSPVYWLGMQLESVQPRQVVVATVALGSPAEGAGVEPGDVIVAVNGKSLNTTSDISGAIGGLRSGDQVEIQVSRGSTMLTTHARLAAPPSTGP